MSPAATRKVPTNVSVRSDLVEAARAFKINISELIEKALERELAELRRQQWLDENDDAIEGYNARVGRHGVFSRGLRRF